LGSLEAGERFAAAGGVPDISPSSGAAVLFIIVGNRDTAENPFGGGNLVRAHSQQQVFGGEDAVARQQIEQGVSGEKCFGEINQIRDDLVAGIRPVKGGALHSRSLK